MTNKLLGTLSNKQGRSSLLEESYPDIASRIEHDFGHHAWSVLHKTLCKLRFISFSQPFRAMLLDDPCLVHPKFYPTVMLEYAD